MPTQQSLASSDVDSLPRQEPTAPAVTDESLIIRNYDTPEAHEVQIRFVDHRGQTAFNRTVSVAPMETVSIQSRLERAVYRVEVRLENGATASAECLIGSDPSECALIETGNGRVSVVEGLF